LETFHARPSDIDAIDALADNSRLKEVSFKRDASYGLGRLLDPVREGNNFHPFPLNSQNEKMARTVDLSILAKCSNLESLIIRENVIPNLEHLRELNNLKQLDLAWVKEADFRFSNLTKFQQVDELWLRGSYAGADQPTIRQPFLVPSQVKSLALENIPLPFQSLSSCAHSLESLRTYSFDFGKGISPFEADGFFFVKVNGEKHLPIKILPKLVKKTVWVLAGVDTERQSYIRLDNPNLPVHSDDFVDPTDYLIDEYTLRVDFPSPELVRKIHQVRFGEFLD